MRFVDALEGYWLASRLNLRPATVTIYRWALEGFTEYLTERGVVDLADVTPAHVTAYLDQLGETLSRSSVSSQWASLSAFWAWAESSLGVDNVVKGKVDRPRAPRRQPTPYTEEEVRRLLEACDYTKRWGTSPRTRTRRSTALRDRAILMVLVDTGLRVSELCSLTVGDYDKATGRLMVRAGKGGHARSVYCGKTAQSALWRYLVERRRREGGDPGPRDPLLASSGGSALGRSNLLHLVKRLAAKAGVRGANIHRFRHTFAINFLRNGGNIYALQALLGHHDLDMVKQYLKLVEADVQEAASTASPADNWRL